MAGKPGRSGRRHSAAPACELPPLGLTELDVARFVAAVAAGVARGDIVPRTADTLGSLARVAAGAVRRAAETAELEQLKAWRDELVGATREHQAAPVGSGTDDDSTPRN